MKLVILFLLSFSQVFATDLTCFSRESVKDDLGVVVEAKLPREFCIFSAKVVFDWNRSYLLIDSISQVLPSKLSPVSITELNQNEVLFKGRLSLINLGGGCDFYENLELEVSAKASKLNEGRVDLNDLKIQAIYETGLDNCHSRGQKRMIPYL